MPKPTSSRSTAINRVVLIGVLIGFAVLVIGASIDRVKRARIAAANPDTAPLQGFEKRPRAEQVKFLDYLLKKHGSPDQRKHWEATREQDKLLEFTVVLIAFHASPETTNPGKATLSQAVDIGLRHLRNDWKGGALDRGGR